MQESEGAWTPFAKTYDPIRCGNIDGTLKDVHDKGIWRAVNAKYRPNKGVTGDKDCTLFVGKLSLKTEESTLREIFGKYGDIKRIRMVRDLVTGYSKGYAFVEFETASQMILAHGHANGIFIDGVRIVVDYELERSMEGWIPRRLGGGFGGKKESGQLRFGCRDRPFLKPYNAQQKDCYNNVHHKQYHKSYNTDYKQHYNHRGRRSAESEKSYSRPNRTRDKPRMEKSRPKPYDNYHHDRRR